MKGEIRVGMQTKLRMVGGRLITFSRFLFQIGMGLSSFYNYSYGLSRSAGGVIAGSFSSKLTQIRFCYIKSEFGTGNVLGLCDVRRGHIDVAHAQSLC